EYGYHAAAHVDDRCAEDRARPVAGPPVDLLAEARVGVGVGDVDRLAGGGDSTRDTLADWHADLADLEPLRDLRPQLTLRLVHDKQRRAVRLHEAGGLVHDDLQQPRQVQLAAEHLDGFQLLSHLARIGGGQRRGGPAPAALGHRIAERPAALA